MYEAGAGSPASGPEGAPGMGASVDMGPMHEFSTSFGDAAKGLDATLGSEGSELSVSPGSVAAVREQTFVDQYHDLRDRLQTNPTPTAEEVNMGAYKEELEPQVRDAVLAMRQKGYNTGSSGFFGYDHAAQAVDVATPIDAATMDQLAEHMVEVADGRIYFEPEDPADMVAVKATWDMIADLLPGFGQHAEPAQSMGAEEFRYATSHEKFDDYLESWVWQTGALDGQMEPLTSTLVHEGWDFGADRRAASRAAAVKYQQTMAAIAREKVASQYA